MDNRLREIERRAAQGDPRAERLYLLERVRAGDLDPKRLRLAATLGDPAARSAVDGVPEEPDLETLVRSLLPWGHAALVRAGIALARAALDARSGLPDEPGAITLRALDAAEAWCLASDEKVSWKLLEQAKAAAVLTSGFDQDVAWLTYEVLATAEAEDDPPAVAHAGEAARLSLRILRAEAAMQAVRDALVPWALNAGTL